jgi:4-hydroxythreonine-4-phosphate dehydrogenase
VEAVCAVQQGRADALVTAPVHKGRMAEVVPGFSGHTEWLARRAGADPADVLMVFSGERVVTACVTRHVPLSRVAGELDERRIARAAVLLWGHVRYDLGRASARLAVCGVNPHASDGGLLGGEEARVIAPAVARAARAVEELDGRGSVTGPVAADAAFRAHVGGRYDAVLAMYHDQATVAAKLADPFRSVNVSVGLPFVRTSPDHGTADDIASSGGADPSSMETALLLAARIAARTGGTCARLDEIRRVLSQAT